MPETIGQRLRREREARYLSLDKAAEETRIRRVFLQALENDDFSVMPSAAQGRGFLRNYAAYLDLDIDALIAEIYRNPIPLPEVSGPLPQVNLAETELPPLIEDKDEKPAPRFLDRFLSRKPKADSTPEADQTNQATDENPLDGEEQAEVQKEAGQGLWRRAAFWLGIKVNEQGQAEGGVIPDEEQKEDAAPAKPDKPADIIMAEIGLRLRERREMLSLTVDEVERHTHLRAVFVKALEEGAFDKLPSTVQTRGMLANYAGFLGMDADEILLRYADALQARRREKYAETPREKIQMRVNPSMPLLRTFIAGDLIFGVLMIAAIFALAVWGVGRVIRSQEEAQAQPTVPPFVDVIGDTLLTPSPELTFVAVDEPSAATATGGDFLFTPEAAVSPSDANVVVSVFALERVFVRISVDGKMAFEGRMAPRETKVFEAENQVVILTGDGSALRITYNGADLGLMGGPGEVVNRAYLVSGVATPTATIPPTATNTPLTTPTFTPTATPTPTATGTANP
jgi:cytoskeletal protein RodZ